jgi:hypothetical protein
MKKIKAKFIIEILGRPPEHIKEALNTLVIKMGSDKGVSIIDKEYHEPKPVKETENLWIAFADVELEFETIHTFFATIMTYMPAHVEIFEPENFKLNVAGINELANFFVATLHKYDAIAKRLVGERSILLKQLEHLKNGGKFEDFAPKKKVEKKVKKKTAKKIKKKKSKAS